MFLVEIQLHYTSNQMHYAQTMVGVRSEQEKEVMNFLKEKGQLGKAWGYFKTARQTAPASAKSQWADATANDGGGDRTKRVMLMGWIAGGWGNTFLRYSRHIDKRDGLHQKHTWLTEKEASIPNHAYVANHISLVDPVSINCRYRVGVGSVMDRSIVDSVSIQGRSRIDTGSINSRSMVYSQSSQGRSMVDPAPVHG